MPRIALVDWSNQGTVDGITSWRPDIPTGIGAWASLDLRDVGINKAVIYLKDRGTALPGKTGRFDFGIDWDREFNNNQRNQLSSLLGIPVPVGSTLRSLLGELLLSRIVKDNLGRRVMKVFDQILFDQPIIRGGATDNFNRTNNTDLGSAWTPARNSCQIVSNRVRANTAGSAEFWNTDTFNNNHYAQGLIYLNSSGFFDVGPSCRMSTDNGGTFYYARGCTSCGDIELRKRVSFSDSGIGSGGTISTSPPVTPFTLKLVVDGSTIEAFVNGSSVVSTTDTSITTGGRAGLFVGPTDGAGELDDWEGGNLTAPPVTATGSISSTATLAATGAVVHKRTASISGTATLSAVGAALVQRSGTITASATLSATGALVVYGDGSILATATLNATGKVFTPRTGSISGLATLTATGVMFTPRTGSISGVGSLTAEGRVIVQRTGSIVGVGNLTAVGNKISARTGSILGIGSLQATGIFFTVVQRTGSIQATGSLTAEGKPVYTGSIQGIGSLAATWNIIDSVVQRTGSINGVATLEAVGTTPSPPALLEIGVYMNGVDPQNHIHKTVISLNARVGTKP